MLTAKNTHSRSTV